MTTPSKIQDDLIKAAKQGDTKLMMELVKQGGDALAGDENGEVIISHLAKLDVPDEQLKEFIEFLAPYNYNKR